MLAGVEDRLVWTLNGVELPTFLDAKVRCRSFDNYPICLVVTLAHVVSAGES